MTGNKHQNCPVHGVTNLTPECARLLTEWRKAVADRIAAFHAEPSRVSDDFDDAGEREGEIARKAWAMPITSPGALRLRAEIARDTMWSDLDGSGSARYRDLLAGKEPEDDPVVGVFDERAVAELVKAVLETAAEPVWPERGASRDWLAMLRGAGPAGAAPDARHAATWGAILDLRGVRDAIENAIDQMTARLDRLADETTLTHAIAAGWEPEDEDADEAAPEEKADEVPAASDRSAGPVAGSEVEDLVDRAKEGLTALRTLWNASASMPERPSDAVFSFGASMEFVADSIEALLDEIGAAVIPAREGGGDEATAPA
jgi:hypothetical protein